VRSEGRIAGRRPPLIEHQIQPGFKLTAIHVCLLRYFRHFQ
jgi:hypothetical protein